MEQPTIKKMVKCCYGISSNCNDKPYHVFMADYDNLSLNAVKKHLLFVQQDYNLSDIYVIKSTNGFNAICLDKLPLTIIYDIGTNVFSPCDRDFFKYGYGRKYFTLRFDNDKELECILDNRSTKYEKSFAHKEFLEWYFNIKIRCKPLDSNESLDIIQYPSSKNGFHYMPIDLPENYVQSLKRLQL